MDVLILGGGAREHALAWRARQDGWRPFALAGNIGLEETSEIVAGSLGDPESIVQAIRDYRFDLVVVGPEDPLIAGLADQLRAQGAAVVGPSAQAAQLEGSKAFAKQAMAEAGVPTARHHVFRDASAAREYARSRFDAGVGVAVKASGAALGKGVRVCTLLEDAEQAIDDMLVGGSLGEAGSTIVVEDRLMGREFSLLTLCSVPGFRSLPVAQDYKRLLNGDRGPNTGGMGSMCPADWVSDDLKGIAEDQIVAPILRLMLARGTPFTGVLFSGVMVADGQPFCLEYNVRFGDPETQSVVRSIGPGLFDSLAAVAHGGDVPEICRERAAVAVVLAAPGYPEAPAKGAAITVDPMPEGIEVFWAGAKSGPGGPVVSGGRVATVTGVGPSIAEARALAYRGATGLRFDGLQMRSDIAAN